MIHRERLISFLEGSIGLDRGDVQLLPHNSKWTHLFSEEARLLYNQLHLEGLRLYHCGSTSIPSIAAKPIIDIVGSTPSLLELDAKKELLEQLGYECKGEYGIPGRRYSVLYDAPKKKAFVHLHLFAAEDPQVEKHLLFRDYLRANPTAAKEYEAEKVRLVESKTPRSNYSECKSHKISQLIFDAELWKCSEVAGHAN